MKRIRIPFYLLMAVCLFGGWITGLRVWFIAFIAQVGLLLAAVGLNLWTALSFAYTQELSSATAVKGDSLELRLKIVNDKPFPFTLMRVHVQAVARGEEQVLSVNLDPREEQQFSLSLLCPYRGEYTCGITTLELSDLYGLCPMKVSLPRFSWYRPCKVLVYPRLHELHQLPLRGEDDKEWSSTLTRTAEEGDSMTVPRLYRPGDPAKRIHWKASAKARELHVKQYELPLEEQCRILLNNRPGEREGEEALIYQDLMCECAASLARHGLERGHETVLQECRGERGTVSGRLLSDFPALYDWLALLPFDGDVPVEEALAGVRRAGENLRVLYLLTDGLTPSAAEALRALAGQGCEVRCVRIAPGGERGEATEDFPCITITRGEELPALLGGVLL